MACRSGQKRELDFIAQLSAQQTPKSVASSGG
jgi:hypothetical protein